MEKESINSIMATVMKVNGKIIKNMEQGSIITTVENYILDNGNKTKKVVMANILVNMAIDMLDNG